MANRNKLSSLKKINGKLKSDISTQDTTKSEPPTAVSISSISDSEILIDPNASDKLVKNNLKVVSDPKMEFQNNKQQDFLSFESSLDNPSAQKTKVLNYYKFANFAIDNPSILIVSLDLTRIKY